jgi:thioredoxin-related protein
MNLRCSVLALFSLFLLSSITHAQEKPLPADEIMKQALQQAGEENKNVMIIFHASWCGWCHKMDSSMNDESCKKFFDDNFVVRHLVVDEYNEQKKLENPGANELRAKYHGNGEGIPFWLIFDKNGNLLADSEMRPEGAGADTKGDNVGCPAQEKEVAYFINILKKTSRITSDEEAAIYKRFRQNEN